MLISVGSLAFRSLFFREVPSGSVHFGALIFANLCPQFGCLVPSCTNFIVVVKDAEGFIILNSQPVIDNISNKTKIGFEKISQKTKELYLNLKSKIIKKEESEILLEETQLNSNYYELKTDNHQTNNPISKFINEEHSSKEENQIKSDNTL